MWRIGCLFNKREIAIIAWQLHNISEPFATHPSIGPDFQLDLDDERINGGGGGETENRHE